VLDNKNKQYLAIFALKTLIGKFAVLVKPDLNRFSGFHLKAEFVDV